MLRPATRRRRRRIFVGCEGESERSYVRLLQSLCDAQDLSVHLDPQIIDGAGGDAERMIARARARIDRLEKAGGRYPVRYVLLDSDVTVVRQGAGALERLSTQARGAGIELVWQRCCHEAFLLRHMPGCERRDPPTAADALDRLREQIPDYQKGWASERLGKVITIDHVKRAATVDPGLQGLLAEIGLT